MCAVTAIEGRVAAGLQGHRDGDRGARRAGGNHRQVYTAHRAHGRRGRRQLTRPAKSHSQPFAGRGRVGSETTSGGARAAL